jgi:ribosomal protein L37E
MYLMENHMRLLGSVDHTAWITCERCGNTYSGGGQQCSRCGKTPTILQRLGNFSSPSTAKKVSVRGVLRRTRSRGAYPGLAETALLSDRASRRRAARIAFACALGAGALVAYALTKPYLAGIGHTPQTEETRFPAAGPQVQSGQVVTQGNRVLPVQPSVLNGHQNANDETTRTPQSDVSAFYRALQAGNLSVARRRLAGISVNSEVSSQLEQMRTELTSREHTRDALLRHAWHCRALGDWQCVTDNATQAYAIDASSWEAKHLVGWAAKKTSKADNE